MARKKLDSVRKVYRQREQQLARELAELREQRSAQQAQSDHLREMLNHYRAMHRERSVLTAGDVALLSRFYGKVAGALEAQTLHVTRVDTAYQAKQQQWQHAYRQRRGMESVLSRAEEREQAAARRRDRRAGPGKGGAAGPDAWTMLNDE